MVNEDKLLWLFRQVYGELSGCYVEVDTDEGRVDVMKDGNLCWSASLPELLLEYVAVLR